MISFYDSIQVQWIFLITNVERYLLQRYVYLQRYRYFYENNSELSYATIWVSVGHWRACTIVSNVFRKSQRLSVVLIRDHDRSFLMTYVFSHLHSASQNFADSCGRRGSWDINLSAVNAQYRGICLFRITIALGLVAIESSSKLSYYPQRWNFS